MSVLDYLKGALEEEDTQVESACHACGGTGRIDRGGDPQGVQARYERCHVCGGSGVRVHTSGCGSALIGRLFWVGVGFALLIVTLLVPISMIGDAAGSLRSILEALPLGDAIAERPRDSGQPIVIAVLAGVPLVAAVILLNRWRRRLVRRHLAGELPLPPVVGASLLRMLAIVIGVSLALTSVTIATGEDLKADFNRDNPFAEAWAVLVALPGWIYLTWYGLKRLIKKQRADDSGSGWTDASHAPQP